MATATQKFAEVQAAYEVLSDPQERAWYDSHRESILRGDDEAHGNDGPATFRNVRLTSTEEIHNLMRKFNSTVPFTDEPTGFFGIARETFEHLDLEEEAAAEADGRNHQAYPSFGLSGDDYDSVVRPFYNAWGAFSTRKTFAWKDKYRLSDAPDRRVRRLMEKENKKLREKCIREFNDTVRFLVTFVRKRDPRYLPNTQTPEERQKSMRDAAAAQAAKARAANQGKMASYEVPAWAQSQHDSAGEDHFPSSSEAESESELLECVVCEKTFKSDKQLEVHEKSKKHIKALQKLRWKMKKEGAELDLEDGVTEGESRPDTGPAAIDDPSSDASAANTMAHDGEERFTEQQTTTLVEPGGASTSGFDANTSEDDEYAPRSEVQHRLASESGHQGEAIAGNGDDRELATSTEKVSIDTSPAKKKLGKAKAKREKKAAQDSQKAGTFGSTVSTEY